MKNTVLESDEFLEDTKFYNSPWLYGIVTLVVSIIIGGVFMISYFNNKDYARDLQRWKERLNLVAESRASEINNFINNNFSEIRSLADNPSLGIYLTELSVIKQDGKNGHNNIEPSQKSYLRNLLLFTAKRTGFIGDKNIDNIPANVTAGGSSGIMVLDKNNNMIVSTPLKESVRNNITDYAGKYNKAEDGFIDLAKNSDGIPYIGFISPVYSIQGERNEESIIGKVVAIKTIDANLFNLLKQPGSIENTLEILLARVKQDKLEYISPLRDGSELLGNNIDITTDTIDSSAEAYLVKSVNDFSSEQKDYRNQDVLATSRFIDIAGADWILIVKIDKSEAFAKSGAYRSSLSAIFSLAIAIVVMLIIIVWWYSYSRHSVIASKYFKKVAIKAKNQEKLLRLVTDNQPETLYIVDNNQTYWFANKKLVDNCSMSPENIVGKTVTDILGKAHNRHIAKNCEQALSENKTIYDVYKVPSKQFSTNTNKDSDSNNRDIIIRSGYIPVPEIPVSTLPENTSGVLVVEQDISEIHYERERRVSIQKQLIETLLSLVDSRDPFSANHSSMVSTLAGRIAKYMNLDSLMVETTATAASLMNVGKIIVPKDLLTKNEKLSDSEREVIRNSMDNISVMLEKISFDGPVAQTLKQWQEKWDGTGRYKIKGEDILISARIIAVTNAFIGMVSPRSWREALDVEKASEILLEQANKSFDKKVVIALIHYIENMDGRDWLENILKEKKEVA